MRTRSKYVIVAGIWLGILVSVVVIGNAISERGNAALVITALLSCGVIQWVAHVAGVVKENVSNVKRKEVESDCGTRKKD